MNSKRLKPQPGPSRVHLRLHEVGDVRIASFGAQPRSLLLKLVVEALCEEFGELLCILLLVLVETKRSNERLGVVDGLLGGLEEGEKDLELEEGRSLGTSK